MDIMQCPKPIFAVGNFGGESLTNLANCPWFAKLKPVKFVLIINNLLADLYNSFTKHLSPNAQKM